MFARPGRAFVHDQGGQECVHDQGGRACLHDQEWRACNVPPSVAGVRPGGGLGIALCDGDAVGLTTMTRGYVCCSIIAIRVETYGRHDESAPDQAVLLRPQPQSEV